MWRVVLVFTTLAILHRPFYSFFSRLVRAEAPMTLGPDCVRSWNQTWLSFSWDQLGLSPCLVHHYRRGENPSSENFPKPPPPLVLSPALLISHRSPPHHPSSVSLKPPCLALTVSPHHYLFPSLPPLLPVDTEDQRGADLGFQLSELRSQSTAAACRLRWGFSLVFVMA